MTSTRLRYNSLRAALGASLTASGTTITFAAPLTHSNGTNVPTIAGGDYIPLSILNDGELEEIVYLTAYTSGATTGTITRGRETTTGVTHAIGLVVICAPSALDLGEEWTAFPWATNWSTHGSLNGGRYCRDADRVYVDAYGIRATSTFTSGGTVGILPAGFRPGSGGLLLPPTRPVLVNTSGTFSQAYASVSTGGVITVTTSAAASIAVGAALLMTFDFPLN